MKLAVCVVSIAMASATYARYELAISRKFTGDSATEKLWNVVALVGLRSELPFDCLFITLCYEIHSGLCMAAAAGMAMSLLVGKRKGYTEMYRVYYQSLILLDEVTVLDFKVISRMMFLTSPQLTVQLLFLSQRHTSSVPLIRVVVAAIAMIGIGSGRRGGQERLEDFSEFNSFPS
ncbi:hypothetical protein FOZ62_020235 [Perkinsus olseni]|uniref:Uncharacterized protein n=1 Tax=Perkinsus olseni TaxID=32597 RepID=A0A7J6SC62_PEROL|nr:hypothetical protein FOZ62_020235 [Perkinsus olseni]